MKGVEDILQFPVQRGEWKQKQDAQANSRVEWKKRREKKITRWILGR